MPAGDRTGPVGLGPMTGRAAGYCAGFPAPGFMNPMPGRGWGMGRGRGMGRGWGRGRGWRFGYAAMGLPDLPPAYDAASYFAPPSREQETQSLKAQAEHFERALAEIRKRLADLETAQE